MNLPDELIVGKYSIMDKRAGLNPHQDTMHNIVIILSGGVDVKEFMNALVNRYNRKASDFIQCSDDDCCGCLVEGFILGEIHCNECGKRYRVIPEEI